MAEEAFKRKLAAILSSDVEGYSRLMDDDEEATVRTLTSYRSAITDLVQQYRGRVVDSPGDNILAEFASVVDSVNCAVEIQRELAERNVELPDHRKMQFRIGVNLGDVIEEDSRIYGDGVNIAARMESLAEAGGICISGRAHDQVENKLGLEYEDLGKHAVKNISRPIQVYRVLSLPGAAAHRVVQAKETLGRKWRNIGFSAAAIIIVAVALGIWQFYLRRPTVEPASIEKMAYPLPDKPSIAVLPFDNMSGDPEQEYFSDGLTEEIITALSKLPEIFVIARNSTFTYKGKSVKVQQIAEDLGVRYVLEGSVRKGKDNFRITAQLIDALTGHHLWAESYERDLKDIFAVQDEITKNILTALQVKLTSGEYASLLSKGTENLQAYLTYLQALEEIGTETKDCNFLTRQLLKKVIALDPKFPAAYVLLGFTHTSDVMLGASKSPKESFAKALELAKKAIALNDSFPTSYALLGWIYIWSRKHEEAIAEYEHALALAPNSAFANMWMSLALRYAGRHREAVGFAEKAIRLDPIPSAFVLRSLGLAYMFNGRYEEAIKNFNRALNVAPNDQMTYINLAVAYIESGKEDEARAAVGEVVRINPEFSISQGKKLLNYKNQSDNDLFINALRKAGLPEYPPLPLPDKPSIAVLAFDNLSSDPEQEYFSDGIAENIITALSKVGELFVIARNSSFTYKGKPVKLQQVGRELGVRYVLEGSVRRSGDRVRITAQLIDAQNGQHLWAENYDRELKNIFEIQDEITLKIVTALRVELTEGEQARVWAKQVKNLDVYLKAAQWKSARGEGTKEGILRCGQLAKEIIEIEPDDPIGYRLLGWYYWQLSMRNISPIDSIEKGFELTKKALAMDESDELSHAVLGHIYLKMKNYEKAIESGKRSVELSPNGAMVHTLLGRTLCDAEQLDEGIASIKQGLRLNPFPDYWYYTYLGNCYNQKGQYEAALTEYKKALQRAPEAPQIHGIMAVTYILLGREEEARASAARSMELAPWVTVDIMSKILTFKNTAFVEKTLNAMRKAGFPE